MEEKNTENIVENKSEQTENKDGLVKGVKSFFKKVKGALEKLDKKLDDVMDNDPYLKKDDNQEEQEDKE